MLIDNSLPVRDLLHQVAAFFTNHIVQMLRLNGEMRGELEKSMSLASQNNKEGTHVKSMLTIPYLDNRTKDI